MASWLFGESEDDKIVKKFLKGKEGQESAFTYVEVSALVSPMSMDEVKHTYHLRDWKTLEISLDDIVLQTSSYALALREKFMEINNYGQSEETTRFLMAAYRAAQQQAEGILEKIMKIAIEKRINTVYYRNLWISSEGALKNWAKEFHLAGAETVLVGDIVPAKTVEHKLRHESRTKGIYVDASRITDMIMQHQQQLLDTVSHFDKMHLFEFPKGAISAKQLLELAGTPNRPWTYSAVTVCNTDRIASLESSGLFLPAMAKFLENTCKTLQSRLGQPCQTCASQTILRCSCDTAFCSEQCRAEHEH
jgi:hypothetical protein